MGDERTGARGEYKDTPAAAESRRRGCLPASRQQVHSPKAITNRYNIAVTVTVSMSGGCICARTISSSIDRAASVSVAPRREAETTR